MGFQGLRMVSLCVIHDVQVPFRKIVVANNRYILLLLRLLVPITYLRYRRNVDNLTSRQGGVISSLDRLAIHPLRSEVGGIISCMP